MNINKKRNRINVIILLIVMTLSLIPFLIMVFGSLKNNISLISMPPDFSLKNLSIDNYKYIFSKGVLTSFKNSLIVSLFTTIIVVIIDSLAGYVFAKKKFRGKKLFFSLLICTMMIPKQILMVPTFILLVKLNIYDTLLGLVLSGSAISFGVFLIKQSMMTLPNDIFEAATLDGCNEINLFTKIALPLSLNSIFALAIFVFVQTWNDYMWQLVMITSKTNLTMPLFISNLMTEKSSMIAYQFSGSVLSTIPIIILFIVFHNYYLNDETDGSLKG